MAQTLFKVLRQQHAGAVIDVLAPDWSRPILERMPEVNRAIAMPLGHGVLGLGERKVLGKSLRSEQYQQAILLPNSLKSALIPFWAKIPKRTGWRGEMRYGLLNDLRRLNKNKYPLMVQRFVALAHKKSASVPTNIPEPVLEVDQNNIQKALQQFSITLDEAILALCPGAEFGAAKQWPAKHYAVVATKHLQQNGQVWIFGSKNDVAAAEEILSGVPESLRSNVHILAGKTNLAQAVDLLSCSCAVVSNDSGLMHIAAALQVPVVAIYGSTSPGFTPPLAKQVAIVKSDLDCSPCFQRECPYGHYNCLKQLEPEKVLAGLEKIQSVEVE